MTIETALDAINNVAMDPKLSYDETREGLLRIQTHVAHMITHFPRRTDPDLPLKRVQ